MKSKTYRTIILLDPSLKLIYGHSILWHLSEIDYTNTSWKNVQLPKINIFFKDISESEFKDSLQSKKIYINHKNQEFEIPLPNEQECLFLEQKYETDEYNPFVSLCTAAEYFFPVALESHDVDFFQTHKKQLSEIEEAFNIPLSKYPHLLETFTIFTPTHLEENFKGFNNGDNSGYEIAFSDHFNLYSGATVKVEAMNKGEIKTYTYTLDNEKHIVQTGSVPDSVITTITLSGQIIYKSSFSLVKSIRVKSSIVSTRQIEHKGEIISQTLTNESNFDV